jgi:hypothetical protein
MRESRVWQWFQEFAVNPVINKFQKNRIFSWYFQLVSILWFFSIFTIQTISYEPSGPLQDSQRQTTTSIKDPANLKTHRGMSFHALYL